jgi:hypothetical protein
LSAARTSVAIEPLHSLLQIRAVICVMRRAFGIG